MPGFAIQPGFALAGMPASRKTPPPADDRFSHALHERPKAAAQDSGETNDAAADNNHGVDKTGPRHEDGRDDKVGQSEQGKDDHADEDGEGKKKDDKGGGNALPPHMMAERTLAGQWSGADQPVATKDGSAAAGVQAGGPDTAAPAIGGAQAVPSAGAKAALQPGAAFPAQGLPVEPARALVDGATGTVQARPAEAHPMPDSISVTASTAADAGKSAPLAASSAITAKIVAAQRQDGGASPAGSATTPAADAKADMAAKIVQAAAGQGSGNTDAGTDGQGGDGQPGKAAQNAAQLSPGAKGDAASAPLPTAQMVPSSGGAASFAGALQQGGALARYAAAAAAALAAGTSASALPAQSLSIQLRPVELGAVTAHLKYAGGGLSIDIQVETPEAHRRLSGDSSDIVKSLQSLGFQVDKVTVRQALAQPQSQGQAQGQSQGQSQGQAMAHGGSSGGFASGGGSPFSTSGQSGGNGRQGSESGNEDGSERSVAMVRETADRVSRRGVFI
jgi:hypothetical protein